MGVFVGRGDLGVIKRDEKVRIGVSNWPYLWSKET